MEPDWVTVSDAAARETQAGRAVNKSSISRFLARNADVPVQRDEQGRVKLVDYAALVAARSGSLSVQDNAAARSAPAPEPTRSSVGDGFSARKRAADAELAEIELAERKGELISRAAVSSALQAAGVAFVQGLDRRRRLLAQSIAGEADVRTVDAILKREDRKLLDSLSTILAKAGEGIDMTSQEDAAPAA